MRPKLSKISLTAITVLGDKKPLNCDLFERTVGQKITNLSMAIDQGNASIADLESKLSETKERLTIQVGEYVAWCDALASYYQSQQAEAAGQPGIPIAAPGGAMPEGLEVVTTPPATPEPRATDKPTDGPQGDISEPGPKGPDEAGTEATKSKADQSV